MEGASTDKRHGSMIHSTHCAQPVGRHKWGCEVGEGLGTSHHVPGLYIRSDKVEAVAFHSLLHLHWSESLLSRRCDSLKASLVARLTQVKLTLFTVIHGFRGREGEGVLVGVILSAVVTVPHATRLWIDFPCITPLQRVSGVGGMELRGRGMTTTTECERTGRVTAAVVVEISDCAQTVRAGVT